MTSQSEPKCLPKYFPKPPKIHPKTKPQKNTKNHRIWLPKWSQNGAKTIPKLCPEASRNGSQIQLRFFIVFGAVLPPPGFPLASLLAPFGCLWAPFWRLLAPFGFLWAPLGLSLAPLGLTLGFQHSNKGLHRQRRRNFAEILPRFCRERAENPPRTRREPAV